MLDATADLLIARLAAKLKPGPEAALAFDDWRQYFSAAKASPDDAWVRGLAEKALNDLQPHLL